MKREKILAPAHNVIISTAYRIAEMNPIVRHVEIDEVAKRMGIRPSALAKAVREAERRPRTARRPLTSAHTPSPVATTSTDPGKELVSAAEVCAVFRDFLLGDKGGDR